MANQDDAAAGDQHIGPGLHLIEHEEPAVRVSPRRLRRMLIASDVVAIIVGMVVATVIQQLVEPVPDFILRDEALFAAIMVPIWVLMMGANHLFLARAVSQFAEEMRHLLMAGLMSVGFLLAVLFIAQYGELSRLWVGLLLVCVTASLATSRLIARRVFRRLRRDGRLRRPVIIVGTGGDAVSLLHATQRRPELGYEVLGFTGDKACDHGGVAVLGSVDDTLDVMRRTGAIGAILSVASLDPSVVNRLTRTLTDAGCHVTLSSSLHDIDISRTRSQNIDGRLMIYVEPTNRSRTHLFLKRSFDVVVALPVLLLTLPIVLIAAVAIKLDSRAGHVQAGSGRQGRRPLRDLQASHDGAGCRATALGTRWSQRKFRPVVQDAFRSTRDAGRTVPAQDIDRRVAAVVERDAR